MRVCEDQYIDGFRSAEMLSRCLGSYCRSDNHENERIVTQSTSHHTYQFSKVVSLFVPAPVESTHAPIFNHCSDCPRLGVVNDGLAGRNLSRHHVCDEASRSSHALHLTSPKAITSYGVNHTI